MKKKAKIRTKNKSENGEHRQSTTKIGSRLCSTLLHRSSLTSKGTSVIWPPESAVADPLLLTANLPSSCRLSLLFVLIFEHLFLRFTSNYSIFCIKRYISTKHVMFLWNDQSNGIVYHNSVKHVKTIGKRAKIGVKRVTINLSNLDCCSSSNNNKTKATIGMKQNRFLPFQTTSWIYHQHTCSSNNTTQIC